MQSQLDRYLQNFDQILRQNYNKSLEEFSDVVIENLAKIFNSVRGSFFVLFEEKELLKATGFYACTAKQMQVTEFAVGDGLIGEAVRYKQNIHLEDIPRRVLVNTSFLDIDVVSILIIPLIFNDTPCGAVELMNARKLDEEEIELLEQIAKNIASVLLNFLSNLENQRLVEDLKTQTQLLHEKESEMIKYVEELISTQEQMRQKQAQLEDAKQQIEEQNQTLAQTFEALTIKNSKLTDSIRYAKTIQEAILPSANLFGGVFQDFFVLYRPKDIVSGDFYWMSSIGKKIFVAIVDCTGHGVPGAFMSMIGYSQLNKIVNEKQVERPAEILEALHHDIKKALRQGEKNSTDGMDVIICQIALAENGSNIVYAGAKIPLYFIEKNQPKQLQELKATRRSIGGRNVQETPFEETEFFLSKGSILYLASDGFADQHNSQRRRFGSRQLKELLLAKSHLPLAQQIGVLEEAIDTYMVFEEQRDDITVIGLGI